MRDIFVIEAGVPVVVDIIPDEAEAAPVELIVHIAHTGLIDPPVPIEPVDRDIAQDHVVFQAVAVTSVDRVALGQVIRSDRVDQSLNAMFWA